MIQHRQLTRTKQHSLQRILFSILVLFQIGLTKRSYIAVNDVTERNWTVANQYCLDTFGTTLATIENAEDAQIALAATDESKSAALNFWIGLNDIANESQWVNVDGSNCGGNCIFLDSWMNGQPNNWNVQNCAVITGSDHELFTRDGPRNATNMISDGPCGDTYFNFLCNRCDDISNQYLRYESDIKYRLNKLSFNVSVAEQKIVENNTEYAYFAKSLLFVDDDKQQINCNEQFSCVKTNIFFNNNSICYISCTAKWSCGFANIDLSECEKSHVICNGKNACHSMTIQVSDSIVFTHKTLVIDCGIATSCHNMQINLIGNLKSEISCIGLHACDDIFIKTQVGKQDNHLLNLYAYSNNVTFDNGYGYKDENGIQKYIECNTQNSFIEWNNALSKEEITAIILYGFADEIFPCQSLNIKCWEGENNETSSKCDMEYQIK
eukprot:491070_1